jgi:hypothetical protein
MLCTTDISYRELTDLCEGKFGKMDVACPWCGPDCKSSFKRMRRVLRIWHEENGFATYRCARCNLSGWARETALSNKSWNRGETPEQIARRVLLKAKEDRERRLRIETAKQVWDTSIPLAGTLGHKYFTEHRGLDIDRLGPLDHCVRFNERIRAVVALMTDPITGRSTGIHRTFLIADGSKRDRKMLGRQGVIRLSRDEDVTKGLGIAEGIEKSLPILISGWAPMWCAGCANGIAKFPVLAGVEALTIFADADDEGEKAMHQCAVRWSAAGREVFIANHGDAFI